MVGDHVRDWFIFEEHVIGAHFPRKVEDLSTGFEIRLFQPCVCLPPTLNYFEPCLRRLIVCL